MRTYDDPSTVVEEDELYNDYNGNGGQDAAVVKIILVVAAVVLMALSPVPIVFAFVAGVGVWGLLRWVRLRISVIAIVAGFLSLLSVIIMKTSGTFPAIGSAISTLFDNVKKGNIGGGYGQWIHQTLSLMWLGVLIGSIAGFIGAVITRYNIRKNPQLVQSKGEKYYGWRYRRTPLQMLKRNSEIGAMKKGNYSPKGGGDDAVPLGIEEEPINPPDDPADIKYDTPISRYEAEVSRHTILNGATGAGKTITMQNMIRRDMENRKTMFILDCKDDPKFAAKIAAWCKELDLDFYHFDPTMADEYRIHDNPAGPAFYDPLAHGRAQAHADMMISTREWDTSAAVYKAQAQSLLSTVFGVMEEMDVSNENMKGITTNRGNFYTFYELVRKDTNLTKAISTIPGESQIRALADEMEKNIHSGSRSDEAKATQHAMVEYKSQLRGLMSSEGKYMVYPSDHSRKVIDIFDAASKPGNVVLFSLSASKTTDMGALVGSMICTDLTNMTAMRANSGQTNPVSIYIDEFQSLPPTSVKSMLEKARSAKIGITLSFQSVQQVTAAQRGDSSFINALLDTCGNFIFHAGANENTAQMMSQIVGQHQVTVYQTVQRNEQGLFHFNFSNRRNSNLSKKMEDRYIIEPRQFQNLAAPLPDKGIFRTEAIIIKKASLDPVDSHATGPVAHKVLMIPPDYIIKDDYFDPQAPIMRFENNNVPTGINDGLGDAPSFPRPSLAISNGVDGKPQEIINNAGIPERAPSKQPIPVRRGTSPQRGDDLFAAPKEVSPVRRTPQKPPVIPTRPPYQEQEPQKTVPTPQKRAPIPSRQQSQSSSLRQTQQRSVRQPQQQAAPAQGDGAHSLRSARAARMRAGSEQHRLASQQQKSTLLNRKKGIVAPNRRKKD